MKIPCLAISAALLLAPLTASAQSIYGTWTCQRVTADNTAISNVTFVEDGKLRALVNIDFLGLDQEVTAQARYSSDFTFENNMLRDTPQSAKITRLLIDGQDARRSDHAKTMQAALMEADDKAAKVVFTSDTYMIISPQDRPINCVRM